MHAAIVQYINHKPVLLDRANPNDVATMQGFLIIVGILLGLLGVVESGRCISEDEIDKLIERKMVTVMKKYDRKIALFEKKIHSQEKKILSQEKKIRILEEEYLSLDVKEERKNYVRFHTAPNHGINTTLLGNPVEKTIYGHGAQKRIVPGICLNIFSV